MRFEPPKIIWNQNFQSLIKPHTRMGKKMIKPRTIPPPPPPATAMLGINTQGNRRSKRMRALLFWYLVQGDAGLMPD